MKKSIHFVELLMLVFIPTSLVSLSYLVIGQFFKLPHLLLFCILGTVILVPIELGVILKESKREFGRYSLKCAFDGQQKMKIWKVILIAFGLFGFAGVVSALVAPVENQVLSQIRASVLQCLPAGFDWTNFEYYKNFSRPVLIITVMYYGLFNVLIGPVTEELYFRGYLTSHYEKQNNLVPILIAVLFSLYHFWIPFNNVFRILIFGPVAYVTYKKKNIYISIFFHCMCNFLSVVNFALAIL